MLGIIIINYVILLNLTKILKIVKKIIYFIIII